LKSDHHKKSKTDIENSTDGHQTRKEPEISREETVLGGLAHFEKAIEVLDGANMRFTEFRCMIGLYSFELIIRIKVIHADNLRIGNSKLNQLV
jgi:hypothetical protein